MGKNKKKLKEEFNEAFGIAVNQFTEIKSPAEKTSWLIGFTNLTAIKKADSSDISKIINHALNGENNETVISATIKFGEHAIREGVISAGDAIKAMSDVAPCSTDTYKKVLDAFSKVRLNASLHDTSTLEALANIDRQLGA